MNGDSEYRRWVSICDREFWRGVATGAFFGLVAGIGAAILFWWLNQSNP